MTRDSRLWWFVMGCAILAAVSSRMDLLEAILPAQHTDKAHAIIELLSLVTGVIAGVMKASPLPISDHGRKKYVEQSDTVRLDR